MKNAGLLFFTFVFTLLSLLIGCQEMEWKAGDTVALVQLPDIDQHQEMQLIGTRWKFIGIADGTNHTVEIARPSCESCYWVLFGEDGSFRGKSSTNQVMGNFQVGQTASSIKILQYMGTKINEIYDGPEYVQRFRQAARYTITTRGLELHNGKDEKYLLFVPM
ncbi:hypothetical protein [Negadavirga shengliensis]|uniref:DUF306 domain-containing protein n=1 Tax=Negadavirga shengliensis TaxID=1389218 RepID=A0ABV9T029_9BACT